VSYAVPDFNELNATLADGYTAPTAGPSYQKAVEKFAFDAMGNGTLSGSFPSGLTTVNGSPTRAWVHVHVRLPEGLPGDGDLVASVESEENGTWLVTGLNPNLKYDVIGRKDGFRDIIVSNVSPIV